MKIIKSRVDFIVLILIVVNIYIAISIYLPISSLMGHFGSSAGLYIQNFAGSIGYILPLISLYYLFCIYSRKIKLTIRNIEYFLSSIIFIISILTFQALIFNNGNFGLAVMTVLSPYIGNIGVWISSIFLFFISICNILNVTFLELFKFIKDFNRKNFKLVVEYFYTNIFEKLNKRDENSNEESIKFIDNSLSSSDDSSIMDNRVIEDLKREINELKNLLSNISDTNNESVFTQEDETINMDSELTTDDCDQNHNIFNDDLPIDEEVSNEIVIPDDNTKKETISNEKVANETVIPDENLSVSMDFVPTTDDCDQNHNIFNDDLPIDEEVSNEIVIPDDNTKKETISNEKVANETVIPDENLSVSMDFVPTTDDNIKKETISNEKVSNETAILDENLSVSMDFIPTNESNVNGINSVEILKELESNKKLLEDIELKSDDEDHKIDKKDFILPSLNYLNDVPVISRIIDENDIDYKISELISKLKYFKIRGDIVRTYSGPVVTIFEFKPHADVKISKILNLSDDLAMALKAETIRIQAPIPGKDVVGIEIPNKDIETIYLKELFENNIFKNAKSKLTLALGKDIVGNVFVTDLAKLPHLLIAGTTGSGKSVGINAMIISLLYKNSPKDLRFVMIDPKMLEFSMYNDIPHLLTPVITQADEAIIALNSLVVEMERRYKLLSEFRVKNIDGYNDKIKNDSSLGEKLPYIVVVIDELADLMMTGGKEAELSIARLSQMARASGIHLIVATQRPSVDVVTGLIKTNLPSRISFKVGQKIDSKVILDTQGAESLLGKGDMLFTPPGSSKVVRLHAPWVSEDEIDKIVEHLKNEEDVQYDDNFLSIKGKQNRQDLDQNLENEELDELFDEAKNIIFEEKKTSISYLQRRLQIGYNRSARIIEQLEKNGFLSAPNSKNVREIL